MLQPFDPATHTYPPTCSKGLIGTWKRVKLQGLIQDLIQAYWYSISISIQDQTPSRLIHNYINASSDLNQDQFMTTLDLPTYLCTYWAWHYSAQAWCICCEIYMLKLWNFTQNGHCKKLRIFEPLPIDLFLTKTSTTWSHEAACIPLVLLIN